jgi:hypothetical protein
VIVVADTSPLRYLILIEHEYVVPALYGRVLAPPAVMEELAREQAPDVVSGFRTARSGYSSRHQRTQSVCGVQARSSTPGAESRNC